MKQSAKLTVVLVLLAGCSSSPSSMNLLAPFGSTRVPPPGTGGYKKPDTYYQPAMQPGNAAGASVGDAKEATANSLAATDAAAGAAAVPKPADTASGGPSSGIQLVSAAESKAAESKTGGQGSEGQPVSSSAGRTAEQPVRVVEAGRSEAAVPAPIKGMPVNDATKLAEPRPFVPAQPAVDLSQLPKAGAASPSSPAAAGSSSPPASAWKTR